MNEFSALPLSPALAPGIDALGYTVLTPVQAQSLPPILRGLDVIAQAPTGSGKTAAFGLGLLQKLDPALTRAQALVLCPTASWPIRSASNCANSPLASPT